jgi:hypothetical protein
MGDESRIQKRLDDDGVLLVTLNRPEKKNAFDDPQWDGLTDTLHEAAQDPRVAVVLLTGAGGNFSSGVDLGSFAGGEQPPRTDGFPTAFHACESAVLKFGKPMLAAVAGVAVGGGCTIALACDVVYVGESLRMRLPFANLGLVPEFASSYLLQATIGRQRAAELMLSAEWIDATPARRGAAGRRPGQGARDRPVADLRAGRHQGHAPGRTPRRHRGGARSRARGNGEARRLSGERRSRHGLHAEARPRLQAVPQAALTCGRASTP